MFPGAGAGLGLGCDVITAQTYLLQERKPHLSPSFAVSTHLAQQYLVNGLSFGTESEMMDD